MVRRVFYKYYCGSRGRIVKKREIGRLDGLLSVYFREN